MGKLIIEGNSVYEIDEECIRKKEEHKKKDREESLRQRQEKNKYSD